MGLHSSRVFVMVLGFMFMLRVGLVDKLAGGQRLGFNTIITGKTRQGAFEDDVRMSVL